MPLLAPRFFSSPAAAWVLCALTGALLAWPWGPIAATWVAALAGLGCALGRAPEPSRSVASAGRRGAMGFAFLCLLALAARTMVAVTALHPGIRFYAFLDDIVCGLPFTVFWAYVAGLLIVGPFARQAHRLARDEAADGWQRLLMTAAAAWSFALLPAMLMAGRGDPSSAFVAAGGFGLAWLTAGCVIVHHVRSRLWLARVRAGALTGFRIREVESVTERETLRLMLSGYARSGPMQTLVQVKDMGSGAYRQGPVEEPVALVPALGARLDATSPALMATIVPIAQGLLLLFFWSSGG